MATKHKEESTLPESRRQGGRADPAPPGGGAMRTGKAAVVPAPARASASAPGAAT